MKILIAAPTTREYTNMLGTIARTGITKNEYAVICCGVGKAAAAASVASVLSRVDMKFDAVAVVGFAAGTEGFSQGEIVMPSVARYHDCNVPDGFVPELTDPYQLLSGDGITVFTGDAFVDAKIVTDIKRRYGVERALFDMEICAVAIAASQCGKLPVAAVKIISDIPEAGHTDQSYEEFADSHSDFAPILEYLERL